MGEETVKKTGKKGKLWLLLIPVLILAAAAVAVFTVVLPNNRYNEALQMLQEGRYDEAKAGFEALGGYKDSAEQAKNCDYTYASELYNKGKFEKAQKVFAQLKGFKDSDQLKEACETELRYAEEYEAAAGLYQQGKYEEAKAAFEKLGSYQDSTEQVKLCETVILDGKYAAAAALYTEGRFEEAIEAFTALDGYKDSADQISLCETGILNRRYEAALALLANGQFKEAIEAFTALDGYKDSAEQIQACELGILDQQYQEAVELYNDEKYDKAMKAFKKLGDYKDSYLWMEKSSIKSAKVDGTIYLGRYEQDNDTENGTEAIEWIVLAIRDGKALVTSTYALDAQPYNSFESKSMTWENCSLRRWLNEKFLAAAFSKEEQAFIAETTVTADPWSNMEQGKDTLDKVFLLSAEEARRYFKNDIYRSCAGTPYCMTQKYGRDYSARKNVDWWLRTVWNSGRAIYVEEDGSFMHGNITGDFYTPVGSNGGVAVRPVIWIDMHI